MSLEIHLPHGFDWEYWVERFEKMQKRYLVRWEERFEIIVEVLKSQDNKNSLIIDLGCGTGSLTERILRASDRYEVIAIDFDPTLLVLAEARLTKYGQRVKIIQQDLRDKSWTNNIQRKVDAVISATALHWFSPEQLSELYKQIAYVLRPGGIFLNADHAASNSPTIQKTWEKHREIIRLKEKHSEGDSWSEFFEAYGKALGTNLDTIRQNIVGEWVAIEEGLPLAWHFDRLREFGFASVDCFWRCNCDAIYGGIRA